MIKKIRGFIVYIITSAMGVAASPILAFKVSAEETNIIKPLPISNVNDDVGTGGAMLSYLGSKIVQLLLLIAGILALAYLVYAGIMYITAGGDTAKADKGRAGVVNAVIGIVIITAAYVLVRFAAGVVGNSGLETNVTPNGVF